MADVDFHGAKSLKGLSLDEVLAERRWLAERLGVPPEVLGPELSLGKLASLEFFPGPLSVALGDLEFEFVERFPGAKIPSLDEAVTVEELVVWLVSN